MNAICKSCGRLVGWRNQRGNAMPKVCECGGELVRAAWTPDGWKAVERKPQPKRMRCECALCGRPGMLPGRLRQLAQPESFRVQVRHTPGLLGHLFGGSIETRELDAGSIVCRWHESIEEHSRRGYDGEPYPVGIA